MTVITGPILDSAGQPVNGYLYGAQTARSALGDALVTQTVVRGRVIDGVPYLEDGLTPFEAPPTAVDAEAFQFVEDFRNYDRQTTRYVTIPPTGPVAYAELEDRAQPAGSSVWIVPGWARELVDAHAGIEASVAIAIEARAASEQSASASEQSASESQQSAAVALAAKAATVTTGAVVGDNLVLTRTDGGTVVAGNVRGPQGAQGLPGVNAVANDTATAAQINDSNSQTRAALTAVSLAVIQAVADGVTSQSTTIQAQLDAISAAGGGTAILPGRDNWYAIGKTLYIPENVELRCFGARIRALAGCGAVASAGGQRLETKAPNAPTAVAATTGGTIAAGTQHYWVTAVTAAGGETMPTHAQVDTTGTTSKVTVSWTASIVRTGGSPVAKYRVYGRAYATLQLLGEVTGTSFVDTGAAGTTASLPTLPTTFGRTKRIAIKGGVWDVQGLTVNQPNASSWQSGYRGHGFDFQKVDGLWLEPELIMNAAKWAIAVADFTDLSTPSLVFDTDSDGIHVLGPGRNWNGGNFRGKVGDDMVGLSTVEWYNYAVSEGDLTDIFLDVVKVDEGPSAVRILGGTGREHRNIEIGHISGILNEAFAGAVYANDDQEQAHRKGTTLRRVRIHDVEVDTPSEDMIRLSPSYMEDVEIAVARRPSTASGHAVHVGGTGCVSKNIRFRGVTNNNGFDILVDGGTHDSIIVEDSQGGQRKLHIGSGTIVGQIIHRNCHVTTTGLITRVDGTVETIIYEGCTAAGVGIRSGMLELGATTVKKVIVRASKIFGVSGDSAFIILNNGSIVNLAQIEGSETMSSAPGNVSAIYNNLGTLDRAIIRALIFAGQAVFKTRGGTTVLAIEGVTTTAPLVGKYGSANTGLILLGARASTYAAAPITGDATGVIVRSKSGELALDISALGKGSGDMATNTNASLSCGAGLVVSDGASWKNVYTGATY